MGRSRADALLAGPSAAAAAAAAGLSTIRNPAACGGGAQGGGLGGPPTLFAVSCVDARLEAAACAPARQIYAVGPTAIAEGDIVVDVGANIGSFSRTASVLAGASGRVVAVEPLPQVCAALRLNVALHEAWAACTATPAAPIEVLECGLGSQRLANALVTEFPHCTALSTQHRDDGDAVAATLALVRNGFDGGSSGSGGCGGGCGGGGALSASAVVAWLQALLRLLVSSWLGVLYALLHALVFRLLFMRGARLVPCRSATLSDAIEELQLPSVGLLKINVERAEEDVLMGIEPRHLRLIDRVAMQVHDLDGRVGRLEVWLRERGGFAHVRRWQEPRFVGSTLHMLYAWRRQR